MRNRLLKLLLTIFFSLALLAGSDICVDKSALMLNCLAICLAIITLDSLLQKKSRNLRTRSITSILYSYKFHPCWAWLIWAGYMGIRIFQTPNHYYQLTHGYALGIGTLGFIIGFIMIFYKKPKSWIMSAWLLSLVMMCFIQIIFSLIQVNVDSNFAFHKRTTILETSYITGTFFYDGGFGLFCGLISAFVGTYLLSQFKQLKLLQKIMLGLWLLIMLGFTFTSSSLTGIIAAISAIILFPLFYYLNCIGIFKRSFQWKWLKISGLSIIVILVVAGNMWNQQLPMDERLDIKALERYDARLQYGDLALALIQEKPWFGHGALMYHHLYLTVYDGDSSIWANQDITWVHQEVLQLICDYGIVGLTLFLIAIIWSVIYFLQLAKQKIKAQETTPYTHWLNQAWPFFILAVAILLTTIGDYSLHYTSNCFLLGLSLGALNAWLKPIKNEVVQNMDNSLSS